MIPCSKSDCKAPIIHWHDDGAIIACLAVVNGEPCPHEDAYIPCYAPRVQPERDALAERVRALADRIDRHTEVEPDPVMFRDADTGVWWEVSDAIRAALAEDAQPTTEGDNYE